MVILVDTGDRPAGIADKMEAHSRGLLHRAFSVFIFNGRGELLIQRRAADKYHSPGLWANTCCSHPSPGEDTALAAAARLEYEMGISAPLVYRTYFIYREPVGGGLTEHEYDHIFTGHSDETPSPRPAEVAEYRWEDIGKLSRDMELNPEAYCAWFRIIFERFNDKIKLWAR